MLLEFIEQLKNGSLRLIRLLIDGASILGCYSTQNSVLLISIEWLKDGSLSSSRDLRPVQTSIVTRALTETRESNINILAFHLSIRGEEKSFETFFLAWIFL